METLAEEPIDFKITRIPYFLRPELPGIGQQQLSDDECPERWGDMIDHYTRKHPEKFGGKGQPPNARFGLAWQGAEVGLKFSFNQPMSHSMDSVRLLMKVQSEHSPEQREKLYEAIARKYYTEGRKLADHDMLIEAAEEAGVPTQGLREWLVGDAMTAEIQRMYAEIFYGWGYTSVPVTLVSCEGLDQCINGSQNLDAYLYVFRRIIDEPLRVVNPDEKIPIWEKMSKMAQQQGTVHGRDFRWEAFDIFHGKTAELMRSPKKLEERRMLNAS